MMLTVVTMTSSTSSWYYKDITYSALSRLTHTVTTLRFDDLMLTVNLQPSEAEENTTHGNNAGSVKMSAWPLWEWDVLFSLCHNSLKMQSGSFRPLKL